MEGADDLEDETVTANIGKQKHGSATDDEVVQRLVSTSLLYNRQRYENSQSYSLLR